jgi:hypothetical protein
MFQIMNSILGRPNRERRCLKSMPANKWSAKSPCFKGKKLKLDGKLVFGQEAPDPEDIKWENLECTAGRRGR